MKDKIISWIIWATIWWIIVYSYGYFMNNSNTNWFTWSPSWFTKGGFDPSNMSDDQLQRMATRAWISLEELKSKIASWENIRDIVPMWNRWNRTWTWLTNNNIIGTWVGEAQ